MKVLFRNRIDVDESFNEASEERVSALAGIVDELEKTDVKRQSFLRNAPVRA